MAVVLWWILVWILGHNHIIPAEVLVQYKYFIAGENQRVSLQAPAETKGREFIWVWTSHDGRYTNATFITIQSDGQYSKNVGMSFISVERDYALSLKPELKIAGIYTLIQTKPEKVPLVQVEVFAVEVKPSRYLKVNEASDMTMSCEVSHLPDTATLDWEKDGEPTANTTLIYNRTAHIIVYSADLYSEAKYTCKFRWNGASIFGIDNTLRVTEGTYDKQHTLYRGSLNSSEVVLICHYEHAYSRASWSWAQGPGKHGIIVATAKIFDHASISKVHKERFLSDGYDGKRFNLKISPVKFEDSGTYFCNYEHIQMATITLVTIQVSAVPSSGLSRNQPVVLNCEISQVIGYVTLAWLWMKGGRGELVKQELLRERDPKKMLSLTLPSLSEDQLHWACVVFTESTLRAQVPLHLTLPTAPITDPEMPYSDDGQLLVIILGCTAAVCVVLLLIAGGLLFCCLQRKRAVGGNDDSCAAEAVYSNIAELQDVQDTPTEEKESEEIQYSEFSHATLDRHRQQWQPHPEQGEDDKVVYASICKK